MAYKSSQGNFTGSTSDGHDKILITIHGNLYDVTDFISQHPGGEEVLLNLSGQDATECFEAVGHSEEAILLRETFRAGGSPSGQREEFTETEESNDASDNSSYKNFSNLAIVTIIAILVYSVIFYILMF